MMEHVIIGILILLAAALMGTTLKNSNSASEWKAQYESEQFSHEYEKKWRAGAEDGYRKEIEKHETTKGERDRLALEVANSRNNIAALTKDYGKLADDNKRLYSEKDQLNTLLEKQAKRLEKYEPKKTAPVKKVPAKAVAKKKAEPAVKA